MSKKFVSQEYEIAQAGADVREGTFGTRLRRILSTAFLVVMIIISISAVSFSIIFFLSEVKGSSMMQTINAHYDSKSVKDNVLVNRYTKPKRGDIIVVKNYTKGYLDHYVKRLIGIEGDKIRFERHGASPNYTYKTVVNDVVLEEKYLDKYWGVMAFYGDNIYNYIEDGNSSSITVLFDNDIVRPGNGEKSYILVPKDKIFYMGDNRGSSNWSSFIGYHSHDCTAFGPQPAEYIEGVVADIIKDEESIPSYVLRKLGEFFTFKWLFG